MTGKTLGNWEEAIIKLVENTQDGKLKWKVVNPTLYLPNDDTKGAMLVVNYADKNLLLYRSAYMRQISSGLSATLSITPPSEVKDYRAQLSAYDLKLKLIIYTFPISSLVEDLYKAATFSAAGIDDLISQILSKK